MTPAGGLQAGPSRILQELPRGRFWCLHCPVVLSAGKRASDSLPGPALGVATIILKEYKIRLNLLWLQSRVEDDHQLLVTTSLARESFAGICVSFIVAFTGLNQVGISFSHCCSLLNLVLGGCCQSAKCVLFKKFSFCVDYRDCSEASEDQTEVH